jgi:putative hemolysin
VSGTPLHVWVLCATLLCLSATFSASETALFSLSPRDHSRVGRRVQALLARPRDVLVTVLLGNLVVNLLYFTFASRVRLPGGPLVVGAAALLAILVLGEILPKTLALRAPVPVARFAALPLVWLELYLRPLRRLVTKAIEVSVALLGELGRSERAITPERLAAAMARSASEGLIENREADLLAEIIELGGMRVREIMTPRVDCLLLDAEEDPQAVLREALRRHQAWLPVCERGPDNVIGLVRVKDLLMKGERPVRQLVMPVKFVPEVARVLDLLFEFRRDRTAEAVVIDEWGGTAGVVTVEDVFEEIVGDLRVEGEARVKAVVPLGEGRYRVAGNLSVRHWNEEFGHRVVPIEFETVGGFVTALLGRIPRAGDRVSVGQLVCVVQEVRGRRVLAVDVSVEEAGAER